MDTVKQIIVISRGLSEARDARSINNGEVAENSKAMGNDRDKKLFWELLQRILPKLRIEHVDPPML